MLVCGARWTKEQATGRRVVREYICRGDQPVDTIPNFKYVDLQVDLQQLG